MSADAINSIEEIPLSVNHLYIIPHTAGQDPYTLFQSNLSKSDQDPSIVLTVESVDTSSVTASEYLNSKLLVPRLDLRRQPSNFDNVYYDRNEVAILFKGIQFTFTGLRTGTSSFPKYWSVFSYKGATVEGDVPSNILSFVNTNRFRIFKNIVNLVTAVGTGAGSGGGALTNLANVGGGEGIFRDTAGGIANLRSITSGTGIVVDNPTADEVRVTNDGIISIGNVGSANDIWRDTVGNNANLRSLAGVGGIDVATVGDRINFSLIKTTLTNTAEAVKGQYSTTATTANAGDIVFMAGASPTTDPTTATTLRVNKATPDNVINLKLLTYDTNTRLSYRHQTDVGEVDGIVNFKITGARVDGGAYYEWTIGEISVVAGSVFADGDEGVLDIGNQNAVYSGGNVFGAELVVGTNDNYPVGVISNNQQHTTFETNGLIRSETAPATYITAMGSDAQAIPNKQYVDDAVSAFTVETKANVDDPADAVTGKQVLSTNVGYSTYDGSVYQVIPQSVGTVVTDYTNFNTTYNPRVRWVPEGIVGTSSWPASVGTGSLTEAGSSVTSSTIGSKTALRTTPSSFADLNCRIELDVPTPFLGTTGFTLAFVVQDPALSYIGAPGGRILMGKTNPPLGQSTNLIEWLILATGSGTTTPAVSQYNTPPTDYLPSPFDYASLTGQPVVVISSYSGGTSGTLESSIYSTVGSVLVSTTVVTNASTISLYKFQFGVDGTVTNRSTDIRVSEVIGWDSEITGVPRQAIADTLLNEYNGASVGTVSVSRDVAPSVGDDTTDGHKVGSRWYDTVANREYVCLDPSAGSAVWKETTVASTNALPSTGLITAYTMGNTASPPTGEITFMNGVTPLSSPYTGANAVRISKLNIDGVNSIYPSFLQASSVNQQYAVRRYRSSVDGSVDGYVFFQQNDPVTDGGTYYEIVLKNFSTVGTVTEGDRVTFEPQTAGLIGNLGDVNTSGVVDTNLLSWNDTNKAWEPIPRTDVASGGDGITVTAGVITTDLKTNGGLVIETNQLALDVGATAITGTMSATNGGTGISSYTIGDQLYANTLTTLAKFAPVDGQIKVNTFDTNLTSGASLTFTALTTEVDIVYRITGETTTALNLSSAPTTSVPLNYGGVFLALGSVGVNGDFYRLGATPAEDRWIQNGVPGQLSSYRIQGSYSNKTASNSGRIKIRVYNPLSAFSYEKSVPLAQGLTADNFGIDLITISDGANLLPPNGTGGGYKFGISSSTSVDVVIQSITRIDSTYSPRT